MGNAKVHNLVFLNSGTDPKLCHELKQIFPRHILATVGTADSGTDFLSDVHCIIVPAQVDKMRAELTSLNHCAVSFLSRASVNLCGTTVQLMDIIQSGSRGSG